MGRAELAARAAAVVAPVVGLAGYLGWVGLRFGDPLLPFSAQVDPTLRGGTFVDPVPGVLAAARGLAAGDLQGSGLHVLWAALALGLSVVVWRLVASGRLPLSWGVLTAATLLLALTARDMTSFERYTGVAVPLLLGAAIVTGLSRLRSITMVVAPLVLGAYATMAFLHLYVP